MFITVFIQQNFGWLGWAKNGENAGTVGYVYQMEAIQVQLVRKEATGPVTGNAFIEKGKNNPVISYQSFVKDQGWQGKSNKWSNIWNDWTELMDRSNENANFRYNTNWGY